MFQPVYRRAVRHLLTRAIETSLSGTHQLPKIPRIPRIQEKCSPERSLQAETLTPSLDTPQTAITTIIAKPRKPEKTGNRQ
jgi:hypothetical protein